MDIPRNDGSSFKCTKRQKLGNHDYSVKIKHTYQENTESISEAFLNRKSVQLENGAEVFSSPFTCCVLPEFLQPDAFLNELKHELTQLNFEKKINDLYQFEQSKGLEKCSLPQICKFKKFLQTDVLEWMKNITKLPLTNKVDISCSSYTLTDHLLCHDDELEGRRIAYVFYLVPEWFEEDGGNLDLFGTVDGRPDEVCKSIVPKWNNFVFFEVSQFSFHQVSEVLTSKKRIALSGWFHGPPLKRPAYKQVPTVFKEPCQHEIDITEWINPVYLDGQTQIDIQETFEDNSEISLPDFLQTKKYDEVCKALTNSKTSWHKKGPANWRNIHEADDDEVPGILKECCALFTSEAFLVILSNLTALALHPICEDGARLAKVFSSVRKWSAGSYSLLWDQSFSQAVSLHAFMYFNCQDWESIYNGYCSFVADGEDEELLRIEPASNSLALVYVTERTSHFIKYVNSKAKENILPFFNDIFCMYVEDGDKSCEK